MSLAPSEKFLLDHQVLLKCLDSDEEISEAMIVTADVNSHGKRNILSRFGDDIWIFPESIYPSGAVPSTRKINFGKLKFLGHRDVCKLAMIKYYLVGLPGGKSPQGGTIKNFFNHSVAFLNYLASIGIKELSEVNPFIGAQYVECQKSIITARGRKMTSASLFNKLVRVESLHQLLQNTKYTFPHPWPETSAMGLTRCKKNLTGKTPVIPINVSKQIMKYSNNFLENARDTLVNSDENNVRNVEAACMLIILMVTGIRIHELASLEAGCVFEKHNDFGETEYWIKGVSSKTGEGKTEWLAPSIVKEAVSVLEIIATPHHKLFTDRQPKKHENIRATSERLLFLRLKRKNVIESLNVTELNNRLKIFVKSSGIDWDFSSHQCRRTFAVYVARHILGDLRYLREHYKHWSIDMTAIYAANESQDRELYDDIYKSMIDFKHAKVRHWLDPQTSIAGGAGEKIKIFRSNDESVRTYQSRSEMIVGVSNTISIRATGVAWCTADLGGCNGGSAADRTKCGDCDGSIIDEKLQAKWEAIYAQQIELLNLDDIGEQGKVTARRALSRCEKVLTDLGADLYKLKKAVDS